MSAAVTVQPSASGLAIRDYRPSDEAEALRLVRLTLGEGTSFARDLQFWRWKHADNPFGASQVLLAADGEIVGLRAFLRWSFRTPAGLMRAVRAVDTATHPEHRRRGVFSILTRAAVERARGDGVDLIFNTPNPISKAGYLKLGWREVGRPALLAKVLNVPRVVRALARRKLVSPAGQDAFSSVSMESVDDLLAHPDLDKLLIADDHVRAGGITTARSAEFLRWRYSAAPSLRYTCAWLAERGLSAAAIMRPNLRRGLREILIAELLVGKDQPAATMLLRRIARTCSADYLVASATPGTAHWTALRRAGFLPVPRRFGPTLVVNPLNQRAAALSPWSLFQWRFSLGDLEIF